MGYAILQYAMNTSDINGIPGQGSFPPPAADSLTVPPVTPRP